MLSDYLLKQNVGSDALSPNPWKPDGRGAPPLAIMEAQERAQQRAQDHAIARELQWNREQERRRDEERKRSPQAASLNKEASSQQLVADSMTRSDRDRHSPVSQRTSRHKAYRMLTAEEAGPPGENHTNRAASFSTTQRASKNSKPMDADLPVDSSPSSTSSSSSWNGGRSVLPVKTPLSNRRERAFSFERGGDMAPRGSSTQLAAIWRCSDDGPESAAEWEGARSPPGGAKRSGGVGVDSACQGAAPGEGPSRRRLAGG